MKQHYANTVLCLIILTTTAFAQNPGANIHSPWDALLQSHVTNGQVDYKGFQRNQKKLDAYLETLNEANLSTMSADARLAFWINAYNAFTIKLILNHYPLKSIRDIKDPWKQKSWKVAGKTRSLDEIEHKILRKEFKEPRIHFAIVCASIGCPDLWNRAFTGTGVQKELAAATRRFMQSSKHVRTKAKKRAFRGTVKTLHISRIFNWFKGDFSGQERESVADFVGEYATPDTRNFIKSAANKLKISYLDYDWALNEKK